MTTSRRDRIPGPLVARRSNLFYLDSALSTIGLDSNALSSSAYARVTGRIMLLRPMVVKHILWDIYANGTYGVEFVTALGGSTNLFTVAAAFVAASGNTEYTITPDNGDFYLPAGLYYLSLTGNYRRNYYNTSNTGDANIFFSLSSWNGAAGSNDSIPMKLVGWYANIQGLEAFRKLA